MAERSECGAPSTSKLASGPPVRVSQAGDDAHAGRRTVGVEGLLAHHVAQGFADGRCANVDSSWPNRRLTRASASSERQSKTAHGVKDESCAATTR